MQRNIAVYMASGEGDREKNMQRALAGDKRFFPLEIRSDLPVDLVFATTNEAEEILNTFAVELKLPPDLVGSILSGHLYQQVLSLRELGLDGCVVTLGDLGGIHEAIKESADGRGLRKAEIGHVIASTYDRCKSFRKRSMLNGVPVFHKGDDSGFFDGEDQFRDILELAHDYLTDGSMMGFRQRAADHEREVTALCMAKGIGEKIAKAIIADYGSIANLCTASLEDLASFKQDGRKIGQKKAAAIINLLHSGVPSRNDPHIKEM